MTFLVALGAGMFCDAQAQHYTGVAYAADTGQVRYREEHWLFDDHGIPTRLVLYRCPSGEPFARKWVRYVGASWAPEFEMFDNRDGYMEGARHTPGGWKVYVKQNALAPKETAELPERPNAVIDAGFDAFVQAHWGELAHNQALPAAFLMPSRLGYLNLKLISTGSAPRDGVASRQLRMSLDGWLSAIAPTVELSYTEADHRLMQFTGISNIRDAHGKRQRVLIDFPTPDTQAMPTHAQVDAAANAMLVQQCEG